MRQARAWRERAGHCGQAWKQQKELPRMAGNWQRSPLGVTQRHSLTLKSFLAGDRGASPPGVFQHKFPIFNALGAGFCRNSFVLRNLEAKFLKTWNLRGWVWEAERNSTPQVCSENTS